MKLITVAAALLSFAVMVAAANKKYIVTFPNNTSSQVVDDALAELVAGGAKLLHRYSLIQGFAIESPEETMETYRVKAQSLSENKPSIEEDQVVTIQS
ncbi:hypothetical protein BZA05DRAFT_444770 [Tricharina praecox]|uniref:uncharacterized protein n=1 Tax=Tricharina praecox TaxID=43433 RepID=UPI00221E6976|nr:uncharacterized protein BZA05DRAFT_444770 [Tricharina praecox]KAI5852232.1 hypothetical protein BZA05DRAFT_444770 [Tricharina praecox]